MRPPYMDSLLYSILLHKLTLLQLHSKFEFLVVCMPSQSVRRGECSFSLSLSFGAEAKKYSYEQDHRNAWNLLV